MSTRSSVRRDRSNSTKTHSLCSTCGLNARRIDERRTSDRTDRILVDVRGEFGKFRNFDRRSKNRDGLLDESLDDSNSRKIKRFRTRKFEFDRETKRRNAIDVDGVFDRNRRRNVHSIANSDDCVRRNYSVSTKEFDRNDEFRIRRFDRAKRRQFAIRTNRDDEIVERTVRTTTIHIRAKSKNDFDAKREDENDEDRSSKLKTIRASFETRSRKSCEYELGTPPSNVRRRKRKTFDSKIRERSSTTVRGNDDSRLIAFERSILTKSRIRRFYDSNA